MENKVINAIVEMGVPADIKGFKYIVQAVCMFEKDGKLIGKTTELYEKVAEMNGVTECSVERAIRHAIERAMEIGNKVAIEKYLGANKKSNGMILATLYYKLKKQQVNTEEIPMDDTARYYLSECIRLRTQRDMYKTLYNELLEKLQIAS